MIVKIFLKEASGRGASDAESGVCRRIVASARPATIAGLSGRWLKGEALTKLILAADYAGFYLKESVKRYLTARGCEIMDAGQRTTEERMPYLAAVANLTHEIQEGRFKRGILFCSTGASVSILANKYRGVYCVPCESVYTASRASMINGANVLALGSGVLGVDNACQIVDAWMNHTFLQGFDEDSKRWINVCYEKLRQTEEDLFG